MKAGAKGNFSSSLFSQSCAQLGLAPFLSLVVSGRPLHLGLNSLCAMCYSELRAWLGVVLIVIWVCHLLLLFIFKDGIPSNKVNTRKVAKCFYYRTG